MPPLRSGLMDACPDHTKPFLPSGSLSFVLFIQGTLHLKLSASPTRSEKLKDLSCVGAQYLGPWSWAARKAFFSPEAVKVGGDATPVPLQYCLSHSRLGQNPATYLTPSILIRTPLPRPRNYADFTCPIRVFSCASVILIPIASWAPPTPSQAPTHPSNCLSFPALSQAGICSQH